MATHSSILAWRIPWTEELGRLQSMGSLRIRHDWETSLSLFCIGEGNGNPLQYSCLENPRDRGAWWAAVYGVTQSQTRLKQLSSSSSSSSPPEQNLVFHTASPSHQASGTSLLTSSTREHTEKIRTTVPLASRTNNTITESYPKWKEIRLCPRCRNKINLKKNN